MQVVLTDPSRANLVDYFIREILQTNLQNPQKHRIAEKIKGIYLFQASGMTSMVNFNGEIIEIGRQSNGKIRAKVRGELNTLLEIILGANYIWLFLKGKIRINGNLIKLLNLLKLLRM
ncbi:MAG: hypothetical protein D6813_04850 [Calditrichaeota bacterium]|nr:MAG: hypothetical protein D6813_04850 [Calditrichota bacterium]